MPNNTKLIINYSLTAFGAAMMCLCAVVLAKIQVSTNKAEFVAQYPWARTILVSLAVWGAVMAIHFVLNMKDALRNSTGKAKS